jgi:hypothetical protein
MNSKIRITLAGAACALVCAAALAQAPAVDNAVPGTAPSQGCVWMSGHWDSEGGQWKWVAAHWDLPPSRSATWVGGHWVSSAGNWVWVNGAWNVSDGQQAQPVPPQPPGQAAPSGVPSPSSPAPYVDGQYQAQYGPGGVARAIDQPPTTTEYGPVVDSTEYYPDYGYPEYAYPAYGWAGNPWFWGFPGVALGFGFGPGFRGHGGYFRGGHGFYGHGAFAGRGGFAGRGFAGHPGR